MVAPVISLSQTTVPTTEISLTFEVEPFPGLVISTWGKPRGVGVGVSSGVDVGDSGGTYADTEVGVGVGVGVGVEIGVGVVTGVFVGVGIGVGVALGEGLEGGQPTHANDCMPVLTNTVTPLAVNHTSPSSEFKVVLPSIATSNLNIVPLTAAEAAGVSISYLDSESTSFCTRLTVLPTSCFNPIVVEPVPARLSSLMSISVSAWTSIVLPSKKRSRAVPLPPVLR
jgi:hypothetical protein